MIREEEYSTSQIICGVNNVLFNNNSCTSTNTSTADDMSDTCSLVFDEDPIDLASLTQDELILKKERIRQQTVSELVKTEANYVRDLKLIIKLYIDPIKEHIDIKQIQEVFGCTEGLLNYHREIIHNLEGIPSKPPHLQNVGEVLSKFFESIDYLNLYKEFCSYQNTCIESFEKLKISSKVFSNCIEGAAKSHLTRGLSFPMLIIKPIQRITKYPLLLKSLLENTPIDHMDYGFINYCFLKINSILEEINHQKRLADEKIENDKKIKEIEYSLQNLDSDLKLSNQNRKFIKEGLVSKKLDKELLRCILLNDVLILAKNKKSNSTVKLIVYLENILIRDSIDSLPGYKEGFEILVLNEKKEKIIGLYFSSEVEKKEWLVAIQSLAGGKIDQNKQAKYSWFLKKNSGTFLNSTSSLSSLSSTPTLSIDISMTPSPRSSANLTGLLSNSGCGNVNGGSSGGSNSPSLESPSFNTRQSHSNSGGGNGTIGRSGLISSSATSSGSPSSLSLNSITPTGSLRETRKPPPPPLNVKDIFTSPNNSTTGKPLSGPYSANPSPNSTLTHSVIDSLSPTFQSTVPSSSNFSRASSVPSFYNFQNDPSIQQQLQQQLQQQQQQQQQQQLQQQDTKHNARRMPQTISSISYGSDDTSPSPQLTTTPPSSQVLKPNCMTKPPPPPRNASPYNTITADTEYLSTSASSHPLSAPSSGFNTPLSSSCDYVPIKNGGGSRSFTNLLPPPPPLQFPPPIPIPTTATATTNSSSSNSPRLFPPPPPPSIEFSNLPPPIDFNSLPLPPPPSITTITTTTTTTTTTISTKTEYKSTCTSPIPPPIISNNSKFTPPPLPSSCLNLPPPPDNDDDDGYFSSNNNNNSNSIPPPLPPKTYLYQQGDTNRLPPPPPSSSTTHSVSPTPPPQTTPPSTVIRAKSPVTKPTPAPRAKSPTTTASIISQPIASKPSSSINNNNDNDNNNNDNNNNNNNNQNSINQTCTLPNRSSPFSNINSAFKKTASEIQLPPPPLIVKHAPLPRSSSTIGNVTTNNDLPPPPPFNNNNNSQTTFQPILSNGTCNLFNKPKFHQASLSKSTGITIQGRTTPPIPLTLPTMPK
ncbi:hypothetical protein ACTFIR_006229 [Dictyostelium discoideum]